MHWNVIYGSVCDVFITYRMSVYMLKLNLTFRVENFDDRPLFSSWVFDLYLSTVTLLLIPWLTPPDDEV